MKFNVVSFHSDLLVLFVAGKPPISAGFATRRSTESKTSCSCLKVMSYYSICTICLCLVCLNSHRTSLIGYFT